MADQNFFMEKILPLINCIVTPKDMFLEHTLVKDAKAKRNFYAVNYNPGNIVQLIYQMYHGGVTVVIDHDAKIVKSTPRKVLKALGAEVILVNMPGKESIGFNPLKDLECYEADYVDVFALSCDLVNYFRDAYFSGRPANDLLANLEVEWISTALTYMVYEAIPGGLPALYGIFKEFKADEKLFESYLAGFEEEEDCLHGKECWNSFKNGICEHPEKREEIIKSIEDDLKMFEIPFIQDLFKEEGFSISQIEESGKNKVIFVLDEDGDPFSKAVASLIEKQLVHWLSYHGSNKESVTDMPDLHVVLSRNDTEKCSNLLKDAMAINRGKNHSFIITDF